MNQEHRPANWGAMFFLIALATNRVIVKGRSMKSVTGKVVVITNAGSGNIDSTLFSNRYTNRVLNEWLCRPIRYLWNHSDVTLVSKHTESGYRKARAVSTSQASRRSTVSLPRRWEYYFNSLYFVRASSCLYYESIGTRICFKWFFSSILSGISATGE